MLSPPLWRKAPVFLFAACCALGALARPNSAIAQDEAETTGEPFVGAILIDNIGTYFRNPDRTARLIEEINRSPFTYVIVQVRAYGDAYYQSSMAPRAMGLSASFDPLAALIAGLKRGSTPRKVLAWIEPFRVANVNRAVPVPRDHVASRHAAWLSRNSNFSAQDADGHQYLEPGLKAVQDHLGKVVAELVGKYDIDGVVFDNMRYPGFESDWGYHPQNLGRWRKQTGRSDSPNPDDPAWRQMRRQNIDDCLWRMARGARGARRGILVGAFALSEGPAPESAEDFRATVNYQGALQDWPRWMKQGTVDFLLLANYRDEGEKGEEFDDWNEFGVEMVRATGVEIISAVGGFRNISLDALAQMRRVYGTGLMGVALSSYRDPVMDVASREPFFRALANSVLGEASLRRVFPAVEVAAVELPPPPGSIEEIESPEGKMIEIAEEKKPETEKELEELIEETATRFRVQEESLVQPSDTAVDYLRRRFPNIFPPSIGR